MSQPLIAIGDHGAAAVPAAAADDVDGIDGEGVGGANHRSDIGVITEVLDRHVQRVSTRIDIGDDRLPPPIPIRVNDVAGITVFQQLGVVAHVVRERSRLGAEPGADAGSLCGPFGGTGLGALCRHWAFCRHWGRVTSVRWARMAAVACNRHSFTTRG